MKKVAAGSQPRQPGRPCKHRADAEPSLLATTIKHVDEDGNVTRLTFGNLKLLIQQKRDIEARMSRERRVEILRMVREDRAAMGAFLKEERESERSHAKGWAILRVRPREPRKKPEKQGKRFEREIRRSRPRRLPTYSKDIIDAYGRRGIYYRARYVSGRKGASYIGCAKAVWRYMIREGAFEHDGVGVPSIVSNMGVDALEVGACCDLLESVQRAERANAKLFTTIELNLPCDISPEARVVLLYEFCEKAFGAFDLPYAAVVHNPPEGGDQRNVHGHVMVWWRPIVRTAPYQWQVAKDLATEHDSTEMTTVQRELFAEAMTWVSQAEGKKRIYTGLSHAQRGLAIQPTLKIGKDLVELHRRGERVALIERNAEIILRNEALLAAEQLRDGIKRAEDVRRDLHQLDRHRAKGVQTAPVAAKPPARALAIDAPALTGIRRVRAVAGDIRPAVHLARAVTIAAGVQLDPAPEPASSIAADRLLAAAASAINARSVEMSLDVVSSGKSACLAKSVATTEIVAEVTDSTTAAVSVLPLRASVKPTFDAETLRRLLAMARLHETLRRADERGAGEWDREVGPPGELPDSIPTLQGVGGQRADGSRTSDGFTLVMADLPPKPAVSTMAASAGSCASSFEPLAMGASTSNEKPPSVAQPITGRAFPTLYEAAAVSVSPPAVFAVRVRAVDGSRIADRAPGAKTVSTSVTAAAAVEGAQSVARTNLAMVNSKAKPVASPASRSSRSQRTSGVVGAMPGLFERPAPRPTKLVVTRHMAENALQATPVTAGPLRGIGRPLLHCSPVGSVNLAAVAQPAGAVDGLLDIWQHIEQQRRRRREEEKKVAAGLASVPQAVIQPKPIFAEPTLKLKTRDPKDPQRLSAALIDFLVDIALYPEWLQIQGKRIRYVGGSPMFIAHRRAWAGNQEVLRLVAEVHRRATGGPDELRPEIRSQLNQAVAERVRPAAGAQPGGIVEGIGGISR